jgi:molecular chaperone DnaJ
VRSRRSITVKIPPGVDTGTRVQLVGEGEVGPGGGPAGDLYVEIHVAPHAVFTRDGTDLRCHVTIPMTAAALGTSIRMPLLEADVAEPDSDMELWFELEVRPGTQSGTETVIRGRGVPHLRSQVRGDVIATVDVETPARLDDRQQDLLRELAKLRHEESPDGKIQTPHKGVFGRLRDAFNPR